MLTTIFKRLENHQGEVGWRNRTGMVTEDVLSPSSITSSSPSLTFLPGCSDLLLLTYFEEEGCNFNQNGSRCYSLSTGGFHWCGWISSQHFIKMGSCLVFWKNRVWRNKAWVTFLPETLHSSVWEVWWQWSETHTQTHTQTHTHIYIYTHKQHILTALHFKLS